MTLDLPPKIPDLWLPAKPAIIRAHKGDLDALRALEREKGIRAVLPGMFPLQVGGAPLSYPVVASVATAAPSNTTVMSVGAPSGTVTGDMLIVIVACSGGGGAANPSTPAGWTKLFGISWASSVSYNAFYRISSGASAFSANSGNACEAGIVALRITGHTVTPEASAGMSGASASPAFNTLTPSNIGAVGVLWLACYMLRDNTPLTNPPTDYSVAGSVTHSHASNNLQNRIFSRAYYTSSETPSTLSSDNDTWRTGVIAVR